MFFLIEFFIDCLDEIMFFGELNICLWVVLVRVGRVRFIRMFGVQFLKERVEEEIKQGLKKQEDRKIGRYIYQLTYVSL